MPTLKAGFVLRDRYTFLRRIAAGFAEVWEAADLEAEGQRVAVKVAGGQELTAVMREAFTRETASLSRLRHDHVIELRDSGTDPEVGPWLVLEFAGGGSLADEAVRRRYRDERSILQLLAQCASAVMHAHRENILHRDLKPANILFDDAQLPRVADFNVAKLLGRAFSLSTVRQYFTWAYAAPEQRAGSGGTERSDVYALGLITAELMLGSLIEDHDELRRQVTVCDSSEGLRSLVARMLQPAEPQRPTAAEAVAEFNLLLQQSEHTEPVYLHFTSDALTQFISAGLPGMPLADALDALRNDLAGWLHFEPEMRPDRRGREQYVLIGRRFRYFAVPSDAVPDAQALVVTGLTPVPPDWRDDARAAAVPVPARATVLAPSDRPPRNRCVTLLADLHAHAVRERGAGEDATRRRRDHLKRWETYIEIAREQQNRNEILGDVTDTEYHAGKDVFRFRLRRIPALQILEDRAVCYVAPGGRSLPVGTVVDARGRDLLVRPHDSVSKVGEFPDGGRLLLDLRGEQWTLRRQEEALRTVRNDNAQLRGLAGLLADPASVIPPRRRNIEPIRAGLDESNRRAVELALGTDTLFLIQGPPGTGKTTVITELVGQICRGSPGARILLVSQSNVAVDNVLEGLQKLLPDVSMVRLGRTGAIAESSRPLELQVRLDALSEEVRARAEHAQARLERLASLPLGELDELAAQLRQALSAGDAGDIAAAATMAAAVLDVTDQTPRELLVQLEVAQRLLAAGPEHLHACRTLQEEWLDRSRGALELERHLLGRARIVAGTCVGYMRNRTAADMQYDWVIVDEAGRASAPELLVALVRGKRFVLLGDHRQLPPVLDEEVAQAVVLRQGADEGLLRTSLFEELFEGVVPDARERLVKQYRMHPEIGGLIASSFYPEGLEHGVSEADRAEGAALVGSPVRWLDTSRARDNAEQSANTSKYNPLEIRVIARELACLAEKTQERKRPLRLGVLTAYAAQADRLRAALDAAAGERSWRGLEIQVMTVDASQGKEFDLVFYSAVRSNPGRELGFLADERRLNVALSRAREALTIVGDNESLREARHRFGFNPFRSVTEYFRQDPARRPIVQVEDADVR